MPLYQITLVQGRTDTFKIEARTYVDCKLFLEKMTTAKIKYIKEVEYSNSSNILKTEYNFNLELKALCKTENYTNIIILRYPKQNLTLDKIKKSIVKNLLINGEKIIEILNVMIKEKK
jgi:hypothetical protein